MTGRPSGRCAAQDLARAARSQGAAPDYDEEAIRDNLWALVDAVLASPCCVSAADQEQVVLTRDDVEGLREAYSWLHEIRRVARGLAAQHAAGKGIEALERIAALALLGSNEEEEQ